MKKYKSFEESYENQNLDSFFYKLFNTKMPQNSSSRSLEYNIWRLKNFIGSLWLMYTYIKSEFSLWSTKYFPFSLFNKEKLYHYSMRGLRHFIMDIEEIVDNSGYSILILNSNLDEQFYELDTVFDKKYSKSYEKALMDIEKVIQRKYKNLFVRNRGDYHFDILVSHEDYLMIIKKFEKIYK